MAVTYSETIEPTPGMVRDFDIEGNTVTGTTSKDGDELGDHTNVTTSSVPQSVTTSSNTSKNDDDDAVKKGHSFLGCCCDMRRAVVICNAINLVFSVIFIGLVVVGVGVIKSFRADSVTIDDDTFTGIVDEHNKDVQNVSNELLAYGFGFGISSVIFYSVGIVGALRFNFWATLVTTIWHVVAIVVNGVYLNIFGIVLQIFFLYPHVVFCWELKKETMTPENYKEREEQSCCCV